MKDRLDRQTNDYLDSLRESREPTEQEIEVQMQQLLKRLDDVGDDETIDAILRAKESWKFFLENARECNKLDMSIDNPLLPHVGIAAIGFFDVVEHFFRNSMHEIALEMAQKEIDKNE